MKRLALPAIAALIALAACTDDQAAGGSAVLPTAPNNPVLSVSGASASTAQSTVCLAYRQDLDAAQASLLANPADADARADSAAYATRIARSCQ